jgi:hypothetical protein
MVEETGAERDRRVVDDRGHLKRPQLAVAAARPQPLALLVSHAAHLQQAETFWSATSPSISCARAEQPTWVNRTDPTDLTDNAAAVRRQQAAAGPWYGFCFKGTKYLT